MTKLTLSVDEHVVAGAKRYAEGRGTSVSRLVETMLRMIAQGATSAGVEGRPVRPPVLARLRGSLKRGARKDYLAYLERKYR